MGSLSYAPNGMLTNSTVNSSAWTHSYDDFGRILTSQNGSTVTYGFDYDRYGNRFHQSVTAGTGTSVTTPGDNTTNKIASGNGVTYDALGNIRTEIVGGGTTRTYTYDAENRLTSVSGDATATYKYDANNWRVQRTSSTVGTYDYAFDMGGNPTLVFFQGSFMRGEVFLGSTHLATYFNGHTYFPHSNWLGSESVRTNESGTKVQECEWNPFGDLKGCTTGSRYDGYPHDYAGYEYDSETGNFHMQFRYYNPRIGRFLSGDLLAGSVGEPQSLNRLGYTQNNPINATDPNGLTTCLLDGFEIPCDLMARLMLSGAVTYGPPGYGWRMEFQGDRAGCFSRPGDNGDKQLYCPGEEDTLIFYPTPNLPSESELIRRLEDARDSEDEPKTHCFSVFAREVAKELIPGVPGSGGVGEGLDAAKDYAEKHPGTVGAVATAVALRVAAFSPTAGAAILTGARYAVPALTIAIVLNASYKGAEAQMRAIEDRSCDARWSSLFFRQGSK